MAEKVKKFEREIKEEIKELAYTVRAIPEVFQYYALIRALGDYLVKNDFLRGLRELHSVKKSS